MQKIDPEKILKITPSYEVKSLYSKLQKLAYNYWSGTYYHRLNSDDLQNQVRRIVLKAEKYKLINCPVRRQELRKQVYTLAKIEITMR